MEAIENLSSRYLESSILLEKETSFYQHKTAKKARKAWHDFPRDVPCTNTGGEVVPERLLVPWERGRDVDR